MYNILWQGHVAYINLAAIGDSSWNAGPFNNFNPDMIVLKHQIATNIQSEEVSWHLYLFTKIWKKCYFRK